jgi:hypothetical protein
MNRLFGALTSKGFRSRIEPEELALMQIEKRGRAARVGAFGKHFCLPSGEECC